MCNKKSDICVTKIIIPCCQVLASAALADRIQIQICAIDTATVTFAQQSPLRFKKVAVFLPASKQLLLPQTC